MSELSSTVSKTKSSSSFTSSNNNKKMKLNSDHRPIEQSSTEDNNCTKILSILSNEYSTEIPLEMLMASRIHDKCQLSNIMQILNKSLRLPHSHLVRIRDKNEILLCTVSAIKNKIRSCKDFFHFIMDEYKNITLSTITGTEDNRNNEKNDIDDENIFERILQLNENKLIINKIIFKYLHILIENIPLNIAVLLTTDTFKINVPASLPSLRWQYELANGIWPCKFTENKYLEQLYNNCIFTNEEHLEYCQLMDISLYLSKYYYQNKPVGLAIDPRSGNILAIGVDHSNVHPLQHAAMHLIDMVARTQNGGAWNNYITDIHQYEYADADCDDGQINKDLNYKGINRIVMSFIQDKFGKNIKFGAENCMGKSFDERAIELKSKPFVSTPTKSNDDNDNNGLDNLKKYGPYICTGYYIFLTQEPCPMCAMALTHSRAKRIFFNQGNVKKGAFINCMQIQTLNCLNHHYEVFNII